MHQEPEQFAFNLLTRSRRVTYDNLRLRDPEFVASVDALRSPTRAARGHGSRARRRCSSPFRLRELELAQPGVVSPMDMYSAADGLPGDFHLVHLGSKALGGAGLVMTEMVCVSATAGSPPAAPACTPTSRRPAWRRVVDFVHGPVRPRRSASSSGTPAARARPG